MLLHFIKAHNVGVIETGQISRLFAELLQEDGVFGKIRFQSLEGRVGAFRE
jgi:hypothetical protein